MQKMLDFEDALNLAIAECGRCAPIEVPITDAIERVLAEDIISPVNLPPFSKAKVDGYAIFSEDAKDKKAVHEVIGSISAGSYPTERLDRGQAMEIQAEAPLPANSDAVVPLNAVRLIMNGARVGILKKVKKGENITVAGEKLTKGEKILTAGIPLNAIEICMLTMVGIAQVKIFPPPRVGVLSLGNELVKVGKKIKRGQIWDANGIALLTSLYELGTQPEYLGTVTQQKEEILKAILKSKDCNVVILSGVTDQSRKQLLIETFKEAGVEILFDSIAVQPGSSTMFAKKENTLIFALPEEPFTIKVMFDAFISPVLRFMMGFRELYSMKFEALLQNKIRKSDQYHLLQPAIVFIQNDKLMARRCTPLGKGDIFGYAQCNAIMIIPKKVKSIKKGKAVDLIISKPRFSFSKED